MRDAYSPTGFVSDLWEYGGQRIVPTLFLFRYSLNSPLQLFYAHVFMLEAQT